MNQEKSRISIQKQKAIVDEIVKLMDEEGLKNVTVQQICSASGISVGTFYHYFKSKDGIIPKMYCLMDEYFIENRTYLLEAPSTKESIMRFVTCFVDYVEQWGYYANCLITGSYCAPAKTQSDSQSRRLYAILGEILSRGIERGEAVTEIDQPALAELIFIVIRGYLLQWSRKGAEYPVRSIIMRSISDLAGSYFQAPGRS